MWLGGRNVWEKARTKRLDGRMRDRKKDEQMRGCNTNARWALQEEWGWGRRHAWGWSSLHLTPAHPGHILQEGKAKGRKVPGGGVDQTARPRVSCQVMPLPAGPGSQKGQAEQGDTASPQPAPATLTPQPCCEGQERTLGILEDAAWQRLDDDCPCKS